MLKERDDLICDMAETYHILRIEELPVRLLAVLASGLPENSRSKMRIAGRTTDTDTLLLAIIADRLGMLVWFQTEDAKSGTNRPESILKAITGEKDETDVTGYESGSEFEAAKQRILKGGEEND